MCPHSVPAKSLSLVWDLRPAPRCLTTALSMWSWLEGAAAPAFLWFPLSWAKSKGLCQICRLG